MLSPAVKSLAPGAPKGEDYSPFELLPVALSNRNSQTLLGDGASTPWRCPKVV